MALSMLFVTILLVNHISVENTSQNQVQNKSRVNEKRFVRLATGKTIGLHPKNSNKTY